MLMKEFEGKSEKDAIRLAVEELGIPEENLRIELMQKGKSGFLGMGETQKALIRVFYLEEDLPVETEPVEIDAEAEYICEFLHDLFDHMDLDVGVELRSLVDGKAAYELDSDQSALVIGKHGKTLEAVQMLANVVAARRTDGQLKVVLDIEQYREKREAVLTEMAKRVADEVRRTNKGKSLEPMNPFERRLVHLALQHEDGIETKSEGEGAFRKVRILPRN